MFFNSDFTIFNRKYVPKANGQARVSIGELSVTVIDDPFWQKFAQGWEPDTLRIYQSCLKQGATVVDIGAWIGPTLLFALACGAEHIYAIEPNPASFEKLKSLVDLNPRLADRITLINKAVSEQTGMVNMALAVNEEDTSMFGIRTGEPQGRNVEVESSPLIELIDAHEIDKFDLIKIDIEGAEVMLHRDLEILSRRQCQCIHLSVHVPFFHERSDIQAFAGSLKNYTVYDDRGDLLQFEEVKFRLLSESSHPPWGTRHGNFFELLLHTVYRT